MEEKFKNTSDKSRALDDQIEFIKVKLEDLDAESIFKTKEIKKN